MKRIISILLTIALLMCSTLSAFAESSTTTTGFENDPFAVESRNLSYTVYFRNEYGFFLDDHSNTASYLALLKTDGTTLFTRHGTDILYNQVPVSGCVGNREVVFFVADHTIYRYHALSKQIDAILTDDTIVTFYPITSYMLLLGRSITEISNAAVVISDEVQVGLAYTLYDAYEHQEKATTIPDEYIYRTECGPYMLYREEADASVNASINGKTIPHPDYPSGSIWDRDDGCAGFARFIYNYCFGNYGTTVTTGMPKQFTYSAISHLNKGARLRFTKQHSAILVGATSSSVTLYHANWHDNASDPNNKVYYAVYSYSFCQAEMGMLENYVNHASSGETV